MELLLGPVGAGAIGAANSTNLANSHILVSSLMVRWYVDTPVQSRQGKKCRARTRLASVMSWICMSVRGPAAEPTKSSTSSLTGSPKGIPSPTIGRMHKTAIMAGIAKEWTMSDNSVLSQGARTFRGNS